MLDQKNKDSLKEVLKALKNKVNIVFFTQEFECQICSYTRTFLEEVTPLSDKLTLTVFDYEKDADKAKYYHVDKIPAILLLDEKNNDVNMKFYGLPAGYEINSFIKSLMEVSGNKEEFSPGIMQRIKKIDKDVHIQVFVSVTCPYCPQAVIIAHKLALENSRIRSDMVDATVFPYLANKYAVQGVPKIIINEKHELSGAQPVESFLELIDRI